MFVKLGKEFRDFWQYVILVAVMALATFLLLRDDELI